MSCITCMFLLVCFIVFLSFSNLYYYYNTVILNTNTRSRCRSVSDDEDLVQRRKNEEEGEGSSSGDSQYRFSYRSFVHIYFIRVLRFSVRVLCSIWFGQREPGTYGECKKSDCLLVARFSNGVFAGKCISVGWLYGGSARGTGKQRGC